MTAWNLPKGTDMQTELRKLEGDARADLMWEVQHIWPRCINCDTPCHPTELNCPECGGTHLVHLKVRETR